MNSTMLMLAPLALLLTAAATMLGGAMFARHYRHHTNYSPVIPAVRSASALGVVPIAFLLSVWIGVLALVACLAWGMGIAAYVRSRWASEYGVGELGQIAREREGLRSYLRTRREPSWRDNVRDQTRRQLVDTDAVRCVLGPEVTRRDRQPTGAVATVKLGRMNPGPGGNSGVVGLILGRPESGKTTTAIRLLHATAAADPQGSIIILDPKGDRALRECAQAIAAANGTRYWEWSQHDPLDPLANTIVDPKLEIQAAVSRVMAAMDWTEEHYKGVALNAYTDAAEQLRGLQLPLSLSGMSAVLSQQGCRQLKNEALQRAKAGQLEPSAIEQFSQWMKKQPPEWDALGGAASRLMMLDRSGLGVQFAPAAEGARTISSMAEEPGVSYLYLDAGMWPDAAQQVSELLAVALMQDVGRIALTKEHTVTMFIDEVNAIPAARMDAMLMRGRSAGFSLYLGSQTLGAIGAVTPELFSQITGTLSWVVCHSAIGQSESGEDDAERIGRLAGTRIELERTTQTSGGMLALPTGQGSQRQVHGYHAHPDTIRSLPRGHAIVIDVDADTSGQGRAVLCSVTRHQASQLAAI